MAKVGMPSPTFKKVNVKSDELLVSPETPAFEPIVMLLLA